MQNIHVCILPFYMPILWWKNTLMCKQPRMFGIEMKIFVYEGCSWGSRSLPVSFSEQDVSQVKYMAWMTDNVVFSAQQLNSRACEWCRRELTLPVNTPVNIPFRSETNVTHLDKEKGDAIGLEGSTKMTIFDAGFNVRETIQSGMLLKYLLLYIFHLQELLWKVVF